MHRDSQPPRAALRFYKAHGLGNDYLVVEEGAEWSLTPGAVRAVCHRTRGAGSDGIVWLGVGGPPFRLRMFNPDGSEFERSGNGLRVLASWLYRSGRVGGDPFPVEVGGDRVEMRVLAMEAGRYDVVVEMGRCSVEHEETFALNAGDTLRLVRVSVGNPHAVVWGHPDPWIGTPTPEVLSHIGPRLAGHAAFEGGTNVQLARVVADHRVEALVWERGVGRTSASGTSACAVAASAVATGRITPGEVEVRMEGGTLHVQVDESLHVRLRGPVQEVMTGELAADLVANA
jgi:diaminopimelate epimerase